MKFGILSKEKTKTAETEMDQTMTICFPCWFFFFFCKLVNQRVAMKTNREEKRLLMFFL